MLGEFSITLGDRTISDSDNRSRKVWLLLAYMIYCRNRAVSQDELVGLLWNGDEGSSNPLNALKTMFHRVRTLLDQLGSSAGHSLIIRQDGNYAWNNAVPLFLDIDEFEQLCRAAADTSDEETRLAKERQALELYGSDFLPKLGSESWVVPISAYFHNLYIQTVSDAVSLLEARGEHGIAETLCRRAVEIDPYDESLYRQLMRQLLALNRQQDAIEVYQGMSDLLFANFGVMPSDETKALYREAERTVNDREINLGVVRDQLREDNEPGGALVCDYDFFRVIYHAEARAVARSGQAVHICLLSASGAAGSLSRRSLGICMENLLEVIRSSLRRGDVASRCSVSQYILLLPQANYENSCMVCDRIVKTFGRQYPHSPAVLRFSVQPLDPKP